MFPNSYDDDSVLLGDLQDQKSITLGQACTDVDTTLFFDSVVGLQVPTYLRLEDELIYVTGSDLIASSLTVVRPVNAANHVMGTSAFLVVTGAHLTKIRDQAVQTQKYQGLVGVDAAKRPSPLPAEVYIATDTQKVYVCVLPGIWSLLGGATTHADVQREGETDDHLQYFPVDRLIAWHDALGGGHVTDGDDHDHRYGGIGRVAAALSGGLPNKGVGHIRLATDNGALYMSLGSNVWVAATGAPSGAVGIFMQADVTAYGGACPPGWSRYTPLDAKFPKGAISGSYVLNSGGSLTHTHTSSQVPSHKHQIPALNVSSANGGSHSHSFNFSLTSSGTGLASTTASSAGSSYATNSSGSHTHTFTYPAGNTADSIGSASATTGAADSLPPYIEVVFCKKD